MTSPKHKFIELYVEARLREEMLTDQLCKVVELFNPDNHIIGTVPEGINHLLESLMLDKFGKDLMEWVDWWMYDCQHGTRHMSFAVEGRDYDVTDLTFQQFLEIVDASN